MKDWQLIFENNKKIFKFSVISLEVVGLLIDQLSLLALDLLQSLKLQIHTTQVTTKHEIKQV